MSSLQIADVTGMRHADVMRAVRNMEPAWQKVTERKFALSEYKDSTGRTLPCYSLTKTECLYVATKFNDEARAKLILRWEELETGKSQPRFVQQPTAHPKLSDKIQAAKFLAKFLNLNDASKLQIAKTIADPSASPRQTTLSPRERTSRQRTCSQSTGQESRQSSSTRHW